MRIGQGFDVHKFAPTGEFITLGGVQIAYHQALLAHSDGDVLLHAVCDALLGALALGDIGHHFPDTSEIWRNADSRLLLRQVFTLIKQQDFKLGNLDATIVAEEPKIAPHLMAMRSNLAADLSCNIKQISIKATTCEKIGFIGRQEGIAVLANVLLRSI